MDKIKSLADLKKKKDNLQNTMTLREKGDKNESMVQIKVAMATCGIAAGAKQVMETLIDTCDSNKIDAVVTQTGYVNTEKAKELVTKYIMNNELLEGVIPQNYQSIDKQ